MITTMRDFDQRIATLERLVRPAAVPLEAELWRLPRWMHFNEIEVGQAAIARHGGDPVAALNDPVFAILVEAARARRAGTSVPPLFSEAACTKQRSEKLRYA
jgi:hypothetical protein